MQTTVNPNKGIFIYYEFYLTTEVQSSLGETKHDDVWALSTARANTLELNGRNKMEKSGNKRERPVRMR